jgi:hypothetical protein
MDDNGARYWHLLELGTKSIFVECMLDEQAILDKISGEDPDPCFVCTNLIYPANLGNRIEYMPISKVNCAYAGIVNSSYYMNAKYIQSFSVVDTESDYWTKEVKPKALSKIEIPKRRIVFGEDGK